MSFYSFFASALSVVLVLPRCVQFMRGRRMFKGSIATVIFLVSLGSCSNVPDTATTPAEGPTIRTVVNHINCELSFIVNASPNGPVNRANRRIFEYVEKSNDQNIWYKLRLLKDFHFVASVLLTLDVSNNQGVAPSLTFIHPLTSAFSRTLSVGGSVTATQERNKSFSYSVDLANVEKGCDLDQSPPTIGIEGEFGLADIVIEGLNGLGASQNVNIYGSGGPVTPAFDASASADLELTWICTATADACKSLAPDPETTLNFTGTVNFSPPSDPQQPGTMSFTGEALYGGKPQYLVSLSGSTVAPRQSKGANTKTRFLLSGTMTREGSTGVPAGLGFAPSVTLVGFVERKGKTDNYNLSITTGQISPSSETGGKYIYSISGPPKTPLVNPKTRFPEIALVTPSAGASTTTVAAKVAAPASSNTTQFSSTIMFTLGLTANGGPNWTLSSFKGPGGGGSSGQLLSAGRTTTDTLSLTFVAACQNPTDHPITQFSNYWQTIPKCNGTQQALAAAIGYQNNQLLQAFRTP